jgi:hypothetical protein
MEKNIIDIHHSKSCNDFKGSSNIVSSTDNEYLYNKEKYLTNDIMNYLYFEYRHGVDLFSTNELERIIIFSGYKKHKTVALLENHSKEDILKMIEEYNLNILRKSKSAIVSNSMHDKYELKLMKEVHKVEIKNKEVSGTKFNDSDAWGFLNTPSVNVIDLKDLLQSFDHHKLIKNAKKIVKDKDNYKLHEYFEKYYENREKKFKEIFKANLEENDIKFLIGDQYMENELLKKQKKNMSQNISVNLSKSDLTKFSYYFFTSGDVIKNSILEFLDLSSIGKLGQCDRKLYNYIYRTYNIERIARNFCVGIFKNTNLYTNDQNKIKEQYRNYISMYFKRPRIKYGGVYYSRVRYTKVGDYYGFSDQIISTISYYRILRFLPNGEVFSLTTPFVKSNKIMNAIHKNNVEMRRGKYFIDTEDNLIVELAAGSGSYLYRYKVMI